MKPIFFFDVETTGLNPFTYGIHQISGCVDIDGETQESFNIKCNIWPGDAINDKAIAVSHTTREDIAQGRSAKETYKYLVQLFNRYIKDKYNTEDKMFCVGFNTHFDYGFLNEFFRKAGDKYLGSYLFSPPVCAGQLAWKYLYKKRPYMDNYKLYSVATAIGIRVDQDKLHDAEYDIELTKEIFYWSMKQEGLIL